jgi:hypothetical protein
MIEASRSKMIHQQQTVNYKNRAQNDMIKLLPLADKTPKQTARKKSNEKAATNHGQKRQVISKVDNCMSRNKLSSPPAPQILENLIMDDPMTIELRPADFSDAAATAMQTMDLKPDDDDSAGDQVQSHLDGNEKTNSCSSTEEQGKDEEMVPESLDPLNEPIAEMSGGIDTSGVDDPMINELQPEDFTDAAATVMQTMDLEPDDDDSAGDQVQSHFGADGVTTNACQRDRHVRYISKVSSLSRCRRDLRKRMLSFGEPEKLPIYRRVIIPEGWDDSELSADDSPEAIQNKKELCQSKKKSRKRETKPQDWKRNIIKRARAAGESYVDNNGNLVPQKVPPLEGTLCPANCRFKCSETVNAEARAAIFNAYYSLSDESKGVYLFGCLKAAPPKMMTNCSDRHRELAVVYTVNVEQQSIRTCKRAFMSLHCISQSKVDHIICQLKTGLQTARQSLRGKHNTRPNKLSDARRDLVHEHINMFPAQSSHYSRHHNPNRLYLDATLSINSMYTDYVSWIQAKDHIPVSAFMYRTIFCEDFNFGFGSPRSDTCSRCETLKDEMQSRHKEEASAAFDVQKQDRLAAKNGDSLFITFDLQKTLPLPKLAVGEAFYLRKLWLYNVGVHLVSEHQEGAFFQLWTESEGKRGVKEIASSLYTFCHAAGIVDRDQSLVAWSDSCAGQNKNFKMICFWQYMILKKHFKTIEHKFPIPGHSFLDSDRDFAKVESAVKRHETIYSVDQYQTIISGSIKKPKPTVTRVDDKMFNIDEIIKEMRLVKKSVDTAGRKISMRDKVRWIRMSEFGVFEYKHSFSCDEEWKQVVIDGNRGMVIPCPVIQLLPSFNVPIASPKLKDIKVQLKYVPHVYHGMYNSLTSAIGSLPASDSEPEELDESHTDDLPVSVH